MVLENNNRISVESDTVARSDSPKSLAGNGGASLFRRTRVWLNNLWHWRTAWAVRHLSKQLRNDPSFRQSWHANIAMPIYDATRPVCSCDVKPHKEGCTAGQYWANLLRPDINQCNRIADRLMKHLFGA